MTIQENKYRAAKNQAPDTLMLFRLGDYSAFFFDDATYAADELGLVVTSTENNVPMCGFMERNSPEYIKDLVRAGFKVAVCE